MIRGPSQAISQSSASSYPYVYRIRQRLGMPSLEGRFGQRCAVVVRGGMNSAWIEFEDGHRACVGRNFLRRARVIWHARARRLAITRRSALRTEMGWLYTSARPAGRTTKPAARQPRSARPTRGRFLVPRDPRVDFVSPPE